MTNTPGIDDLLYAPGPAIEADGEELAEWLGLSARQVGRLAQDGRAVRLGRNRYDLKASVKAYCEWARDQMPGGRPGGRTSTGRLAEERERLVREQADQVALKNAQARGELVHRAAVEQSWTATLVGVRAAMLSLPVRLSGRLSHLSADDLATIDRELRDLLTETANGGGQ